MKQKYLLGTFRAWGLGLLILGLLGGCSSEPAVKPEPEAKELAPVAKGAAIDTPEMELLSEGKKLFETGMFTVARDSFEALRTGYPLSPHVEFASLKIADCYFETNDYLDAAREYEEFTKSHPVSESSPYALMMAGRSHQLSNRGVGRDTAPLDKALELFKRFAAQYPASPYLASVEKFRNETERTLAQYEQEVIVYYRNKGLTKAADARQALYDARWPHLKDASSDNADKGSSTTAKSPAEILAEIEAVEHSKAPPSVKPAHAAPAKSSTTENRTSISDKPSLISKVECQTGSKRVVALYLNRKLENKELPAEKELTPASGSLLLKLPGGGREDQIRDCFELGDLRITSDGELRLKTTGKVRLMEMSNPARLLLILND